MAKYDGMTVTDILKQKKGSIRSAPLPPGSPTWEQIADWTWQHVDEAARQNKAGFKTIRKLLTDGRFDR